MEGTVSTFIGSCSGNWRRETVFRSFFVVCALIMVTLVVVEHFICPRPSSLRPASSHYVTSRDGFPPFRDNMEGRLKQIVISDQLNQINEKIPVHYVVRSPVPSPRDFMRSEDSPLISSLSHTQEFFTYLQAVQRRCRKQVMLGGRHQCGAVTDDIPDGAKVVCLDDELQLMPQRSPQSCLTLSFGIHRDTSFDTAMAAMNCEVHMFDVLDYSPTDLLHRAPHTHFHKMGLDERRLQRQYLNLVQEIPVDSLEGHLSSNNLVNKPIHILKMDIEGDEWVVMKQLAKRRTMDLIGQIAIEIHNEGLLTLPAEKHLIYLQGHYDILKAIERRGFEKIAYWDNVKSKVYTDATGATHYTCGEIHYINTNWYNTSFKSALVDMGVHF